MRNVEQPKMFKFAHFSYDKTRNYIILRVTRTDNSEAFYIWNKLSDKKKASPYFSENTRILIDASIPEEMRRECEER